jgi:exopolysaccharide production protein ExoQ
MLKLDRQQAPKTTRALWVPTLWILLIGSRPLGRWFQYSAESEASSPLDRTFIVILIIAALWVLGRRQFDWSKAVRENSWLVVLAAYMLVSVLWSRMPEKSFIRWVREMPALLMAFVILTEPSPRQAIQSILRRAIYIFIPFSLILAKYFPVYGVEYGRWSGIQMWTGVAGQKNGLGMLCIISAFYLFWTLVKRWRGKNPCVWKYQTYIEVSILLISIYLLMGPNHDPFYSATSTYSLILAISVYCGLLLMKKLRARLPPVTISAAVGILMLFGIITLFTGGSTVGSAASRAGRDATITGRTEVWAALMPVAMRHPVFGGGFGGFWTPETRSLFEISGAHSGYLDILLDLGFVGLILYSFFIVSSGRKAGRELSFDYDWGALWICYLMMVVLHNTAESSLNSLATFMTAFLIFFSVCSSCHELDDQT